MRDYTNLGLAHTLRSQSSVLSQRMESATNIDLRRGITPGAIPYSAINQIGRPYQAIVDLTNAGGAFTDLQDAFDYVNRLGGGRILVMPATYTISSELTMYSDTSIEGVSQRDCIIDFNNTTNNLTLTSGGRNFKITDLTFNNCRDLTNGAIRSDNNQVVIIERCSFNQNRNGTSGYDIYVAGGSGRVYVRNCLAGTPATFLFFDNAGNTNEIANNLIQDPQRYAFEGGTNGNGGGQTIYNNNVIFDPNLSSFFGEFSDGRIVNNTIVRDNGTTTQVLMDINDSGELRIIGNYINGQGLTNGAIDLNNCDRFVMSGNSIWGSLANTDCITIAASDHGAITGNFIQAEGGTSDGVSIATSQGIKIAGNSIVAGITGSYGINIAATGTETVIVGNYLSGATGDVNNLGTLTVNANNA